MKKFKRFFASFLCVCMIITSCPDILAWAAGDTAVVKTTKFEFSAKKLSKMVQKADKDNTDDNGLCKLSVPKAMNYGKQLKLRAYLQTDEENIVFLFVNKTKKRHAAAIIVDDMMSNIIAVSTKKELLDEEYATDSDSDYDYDVYTDGLLDADFMDMAAQVLDGTSNPSDNDADKEYDHLDGEAFDVVLRDGTVGAALVVSLEALGLDDMGELLPDDEDDEERSVVIASDSNAGSAVVLPGKDTAVVVPGADTPVVLPDQDQRPVVVDLPVATPSNSNVTVATPSNVAKTFIQELNGVKIKAHAEAGVIPDEATFEAIELKETGDTADAYKEACATLDADEETEYDGVMAYDLHFLLDGEEIQPDGEVKITMEVSEKALPENVDPESLEVKHLDETSGTVEVVTVADTGDKADGTIAVNEAVMAASEESDVAEQTATSSNETAVTAEFAVDSFSYFMITYNHNNTNPQLKVYLYDTDGQPLPGTELINYNDGKDSENYYPGKYDPANLNTNLISGGGSRTNRWISIEVTAATFGKYTKQYTYQGAYQTFKNNEFSVPVKWFYYSEGNRGISNGYYGSNSETQPTDKPGSNDVKFSVVSGETYPTIYLKYSKNLDINSQITEEIEQNGWLKYKYPEEGTFEYEWWGSNTGAEDSFTKITPKKITGTTRNIINDDKGNTYLYPALDLDKTNVNRRRWYKVKVFKDGQLCFTTDPIQVPYYAALQNGSFEAPDMEMLYPDAVGDIPNETTGLMWNTTGEDGQVEIVYGGNSLATHGVAPATIPDGEQYVELNAEKAGALYQCVLTAPGSKLNWQLSHRARPFRYQNRHWFSTNDTEKKLSDEMYLIIAPTKLVKDKITTQQDLMDLINGKTNADGTMTPGLLTNPKYYKDLGYDWEKIETKVEQGWVTYTGQYTVPDKGYLTSFFFVAYNTVSSKCGYNDGVSLGNLLDKVSFSTELPAPDPGKANIEISKTVEGVMADDLQDYHVTLLLETKNNNGGWDPVGAEITLDFNQGAESVAPIFSQLAPGKYRVTEQNADFDSEKSQYYTGPTSSLTIKKEEKEGTAKGISTIYGKTSYDMGAAIEFEVKGDCNYQVMFTNTYVTNSIPLTVKKVVDGNMANKHQKFTFTGTVVSGSGTPILETKYAGKAADGTDIEINVGADGKFQVELEDGESITIELPRGTQVTIIEDEAAGYTTKYEVDSNAKQDGRTCEITMDEAHTIKFTNTCNIVIPTGLFDNGRPTGWLYLMAVAAGCFAFGFYRRRKKKLNNGEECL